MQDKMQVTDEVVQRFARYHARDSYMFHIVLEDTNIENNHAQWCANQAKDDEGRELGRMLVAMSKRQRLKLCRRYQETRK